MIAAPSILMKRCTCGLKHVACGLTNPVWARGRRLKFMSSLAVSGDWTYSVRSIWTGTPMGTGIRVLIHSAAASWSGQLLTFPITAWMWEIFRHEGVKPPVYNAEPRCVDWNNRRRP